MNFKIIDEFDIINKYPFYSNHNFNCLYKYKNKYAVIEFNQKFQSSIILITKYYNTLEICLENYDYENDYKFSNIIINKI